MVKCNIFKKLIFKFDKGNMFDSVNSIAGNNNANTTNNNVSPIVAVDHIFKSVTDSTGTLTILRDIHFTLAPRETAAIVGASGSGKSTLLSIIAGLDTPTSGTVRLAGQDIFALSEDDRAALRAQKVGFVFQSFQLMGNLTALENVMLPLLAMRGRPDAEMRQRAEELIDKVGLTPWGHHPANDLSGGQQQRVAIARALVMQPALVLADEPTGNLDTQSADTIFDLMRSVSQTSGTTFLIVTHDPRLAKRCDRIIELVDGRINSDKPNAAK